MLKLLTKTMPWMVASLLVATSGFGQNGNCPRPCTQPCPPTQVCPPPCPDPCCPAWATPLLNAAYNYPARTTTRCPWNVWVDASFIYWQPLEENLEPAMTGSLLAQSTNQTSATGFVVTDRLPCRKIENLNFDFKPGFKVGLGMAFDHDNWDAGIEYTRLHGSHSKSRSLDGTVTTPPANVAAAGVQTVVNNVYLPMQLGEGAALIYMTRLLRLPTGVTTLTSTFSESWRLNMDLLDLDLGRWQYVGTKLTFRPFVGARVAWINQKLHAEYAVINTTTGVAIIANNADYERAHAHAKTRSWGIGPRAGLRTNWIIGSGFRFFGNGAGDILYTTYRYKRTDTLVAVAGSSGAVGLQAGQDISFCVKQNHIHHLRTHLDLELGLGWGTYFKCNNWYLDFAAGYNFQAFFDQNMFRFFTDAYENVNGSAFNYIEMPQSLAPHGNLYIQGLTVTARLDF